MTLVYKLSKSSGEGDHTYVTDSDDFASETTNPLILVEVVSGNIKVSSTASPARCMGQTAFTAMYALLLFVLRVGIAKYLTRRAVIAQALCPHEKTR